jgi:hypothetical protein
MGGSDAHAARGPRPRQSTRRSVCHWHINGVVVPAGMSIAPLIATGNK